MRVAVPLGAILSVAMAYGVTLPVLPFLLERLLGQADAAGVSRHTGWLTGLYTLALFVMSPLWGALSDRVDRRGVMFFGLAGSAVALLALDNVSGLAEIYAARLASGFLSAAVFPAALAYVAEHSPLAEHPRIFALAASATTLGFLLGPALGSWLSPMVVAPPADMRLASVLMADSPFFLVALLNTIAAVAVSALPTMRSARVAPRPTGGEAAIRRYLLLTAVVAFGISTAEVGVTLFGKHELSLGPRGISAFFLACSLVMVVAQSVGFPFVKRRLGDRPIQVSAFALMTVGLSAAALSDSSWAAGLAFVLVSAGTGILIPSLATQISEATTDSQGQALGWQAAAANLGQALAAASTGMLFAAAPAAPFLLGAALLAVGALIAARQRNQSTAGERHGA
ncbi:MAG: MFS transporter [Rhodocyclales bacterium]|nr:MFS transporter [Rhodocyclales bacterium]